MTASLNGFRQIHGQDFRQHVIDGGSGPTLCGSELLVQGDTALVRRAGSRSDAPDAAWAVGAAQWARNNVPTIGRMAQPREMAAVAPDLASDAHPYMTGATILVDGAMTLRA